MGFLKPEHKRWIVWILRGAFLLYLFCLMYLMFLSERYGRAGGLGMYRDRLSFETFFINIYGNVLAFMPFGFLLPVISRKDRRFWSIFLLSVALTLTLETTQLILQVGCFDVDDMILNTAGGVLGYWIYKLSHKLFQKIEKSWNLRN